MMLGEILLLILASLVYGAPVKDHLHKVQLRRAPIVRSGENVHMAFQRHANQAIRRHARMIGREQPSDDDLLDRMKKREDYLLATGQIEKRLWFPPSSNDPEGQKGKRLWFPPEGTEGPSPAVPQIQEDLFGGDGFGHSGDKSKATNVQTAVQATTTVTESGSNANGFSEADLQALEDDSLTKSTSNLVTGGLPYIIEDNDEGYLCEIQAGTPPKSFLMIMDTGSSDTWLPDAACSNCGSHLTLGTDTSSTFKASDQVFTVTYGSGEVNGTLCQDDLTIAGMTLKAHTFGTVTSESSQFSKTFADGLMGLAFDTLSQQRVDTPVESLVQAGLIKEGILGIALGRVADGQNDGELVFGQADSSKLDASTTQTLPVTSQNGFWQVALGAVTVNGKVVSQQRQAILDTGTTLLLAPQQDATAYHAQIPGARDEGQGMFSIPCTTDAVVEMTFGNVAFQIDPRDLIFQPLNNADPTGQCLSSVMAGTVTDDQTWLMGDVLLKNLYMATDVGQRTISLSARTDTPGSSSVGKQINNDAAMSMPGMTSAARGKVTLLSKLGLLGMAGIGYILVL